MTNINSLNELISFNDDFRTSVNLYLSLNKPEKIRSYIPTKSSTAILNDYLNSVINNKEQATMLVGPYGKGKSHLLLILLSILSLDRDKDENTKLVNDLINKISISEGEGSDVVIVLPMFGITMIDFFRFLSRIQRMICSRILFLRLMKH